MADRGVARARIGEGADVSGSSQALFVVDDECNCLEASLGAARMLGFARDEVTGTPLVDLLERDSREAFRLFWMAFGNTGGHAGPFRLSTGAEIQITVEPNVLPARHLVLLAAAAAVGESPLPAAPEISVTGKPPGPRAPTNREREILGLLATGATDGQIAARLDLSPATVQTHVRNAKAKLGARTRAQAVAMALRSGLIQAA
jgi:PAS domain S-box-containing protein